jgi:uncharacterized protein YneF (UPF0154 family)
MEMSTDQVRIIGVALILVVVFALGFWLSRAGRPINSLLLNAHKLIALGVAVYLAVTAYRMHQAASLSGTELAVVVVTGVLFLASGIIGGLVSLEKPPPTILLRLHLILPILTAVSTAATLYLLRGR